MKRGQFLQLAGLLTAVRAPIESLSSLFTQDGVCTPMIARWPGHIPAGATCNELVASVDWAATVMDLVGMTKLFIGAKRMIVPTDDEKSAPAAESKLKIRKKRKANQ